MPARRSTARLVLFVAAGVALLILLVLLSGGTSPRGDRGSPTPRGATEAPTGTAAATATDGATPTGGAPPSGSPTTAAWEERAPAPVPLTEVAAVAHGGRIWVVGGVAADGSASRAVQVYDPAADRWSEGPALPEGVHHAALVSTGAELILVGGYRGGGFGGPVATVLRLADPGAGWQPGPDLPAARAAGAAAWDGTRVVYGGGVGPDGLSGDVLVLEGGAWRHVGALDPAREHLGAASDGAGSSFFLGGRRGGMSGNLAAVDVVSRPAVRHFGELPTARGGVAGFWSADHGACLAGGEEPGGTFGQVECIHPDGTVSRLPDLRQPRHGLGAAVVDGVAYALLGGTLPGLAVSDIVEALVLDRD